MIKNRTFENHRDRWRLLTTRDWISSILDWDGGDTLHREGMWTALTGMRYKESIMYLHEYFHDHVQTRLQHPTKKGLWRRHINIKHYYSDWNRASRDQVWSVVVTMAVLDLEKELDEFYWHVFKRGGFMTNTRKNGATAFNHGKKAWPGAKDLNWFEKLVIKFRIPIIPVHKDTTNYNWKIPDFTGPAFWGHYFRYKVMQKRKWSWAKPFVWLGDIDLWINSLIKVHFYGKDPENADDSNHILPHLYAQWSKTETSIAKHSRRYYFENRPFAGEPILKEYEVSNGPMSALRKYFDGNVWNRAASPPLDRLAQPLVDRMGD